MSERKGKRKREGGREAEKMRECGGGSRSWGGRGLGKSDRESQCVRELYNKKKCGKQDKGHFQKKGTKKYTTSIEKKLPTSI